MLKSDIKRFMTGPVFWLLILVGFVVYTSDFLSFMAYNLIHGLPKEGLREYVGSNLLAFYVELSTSLIGWIYPLLCIIPFSTSLVDEYSNGALRLLVYRTGREKYLWSRFVSVGLSGGLCCSIVICLSAVLTGSILPMAGTSLPEGWPTPERDMQIIKEFNFFYEYFQNVNQSSPSIFFIYAAHQIILNFIGGFIFAVFALGISTWFRNRFFAIAVPIALYILGNASISFFHASIWFLPSIHNLFLDTRTVLSTWFSGHFFLLTMMCRVEWLVIALLLFTFGSRRIMRDV